MMRVFSFFTVLTACLLFSSCAPKQTAAPPASMTAPTFDWDKGPAEINAAVSHYPKPMQATYSKIFKAKCSMCHTLSRSIWAPYYDEALWKKIVGKMSTRPGSEVNPADADKIVKFLVFDHEQRKAEIEKQFQDNHWAKQDPVALP